MMDKPCPIRSSVTDQPCLLSDGHPQWDANRFHRFAAPAQPPVLDPDPSLAYAEDGSVVGRVVGWVNGVPVIDVER